MAILTIHDNELFRELSRRARDCDQSLELAGAVMRASTDVSPLLEFVRQSFPAYPSHGFDHSMRILVRLGQILKREALDQLNSLELFALILAVMLHDVGMVAPDSSTPNDPEVRRTHHQRSAQIAKDFLSTRLPGYSGRLGEVVAFAIRSHGEDWDTIYNDRQFSINETIGQFTLRPRVTSLLLRIGDLLDLDEDRTNAVCFEFFQNWIRDNASEAHHRRHQNVSHFSCTDKLIVVETRCQTKEEYRIWSEWLNYLVREIEQANTYVFRDDLSVFQLPVPSVAVAPSEDSTFELWDLRFEIDDNGMLWDVLRRSVYTGRFDHVRELTSNGIDACLKRAFGIVGPPLLSESPEKWNLGKYEPQIAVIFDRKNLELAIADNGIGMSSKELRSFLFRVASRGRVESWESKAVTLPTIGQFGIGFISVLTRANSVSVTTSKGPDSESGYLVDLDANLRDATVERVASTCSGTTVVLKLKAEESSVKIVNYFRETFLYPAMPITLVDIGAIDTIINIMHREGLQPPEKGDWIEKLRTGGDVNQTIIEIDKFVKRLGSLASSEDRRRGAINRKRLESDRLLPFLGIEKRIGDCTSKVSPDRPRHLDWSTIVFHVSDDGEIVSAEDVGNGKLLRPLERFGIVCVAVDIDDWDEGIEWRSVHGFLVGDHQVSSALIHNFAFGGRSVGSEMILSTDRFASTAELYETLEVQLDDEGIGIAEFLHRHESIGRSIDAMDVDLQNDLARMTVEDISFKGEDGVRAVLDGYSQEQLPEKDEFLIDSVRSWYRPPRDAYRERTTKVCQDGILLPVSLWDIAPVGATRGIANFRGVGRLPLNVSRNAIDETPRVIAQWKKEIGYRILSRISTAVTRSFQACNLTFDLQSVWLGESETPLMTSNDWRSVTS